MIDFVVSGILRILESDDRMYLDKMGIVKKRLFFHNSFLFMPIFAGAVAQQKIFANATAPFFIAKIHERGVV